MPARSASAGGSGLFRKRSRFGRRRPGAAGRPLAFGRVKTRTLLLWALACGLAIMLAGAVFLFQLAGQDDVVASTPLGEPVTVGDMTVTVVDSSEAGGQLAVSVRIGGVDDPDGGAGFRLIASGRPVTPDGGCDATTVEVTDCVVTFDTSSADGTSRVLLFGRGEDSARWVLA